MSDQAVLLARLKRLRSYKPGKYGKGLIQSEQAPQAMLWRVKGGWNGAPHHIDVSKVLQVKRPNVAFHISKQRRFYFHSEDPGFVHPKDPAKLAAHVQRQYPKLTWGKVSAEEYERRHGMRGKTLAMQSRPLRDFERGAHLHVLDWAHQTARHRFQAAGAVQVKAASKAVVKGTVDRPPDLPSLEAALHGELRKLHALGHATVRSELDHQASGEALPVGLSKAPTPPNLRPAKGAKKRCGTCKMFDNGVCWGYGNYPVEPDELCDSWAAETVKALDWHFDPDEPRDWHGRWDGGSAPASLYHRASPADRASIQKRGLIPSNPLGTRDDALYPTGVFLGSPDVAMPGFDLWEVATGGLTVIPDPISADRGHWYSPAVIPPEQLTLTKRGDSAQALARTLAVADRPQDSTHLLERARLAAAHVAHEIWQAVHRGRLHGITNRRVLRQLGTDAGQGALRAAASHHAGGAIASGRRSAAAAHPTTRIVGARYTSVLDKNTCGPCKEADTGELIPVDSPAWIPTPNPACLGGDRCRCIHVYQLATEGEKAPEPPASLLPPDDFPSEPRQPDRPSGVGTVGATQVGVGAS